MITQNDILADLHVHTIASLHAYSTIWENIQIAKERGLEYIAITDHYFNLGDAITTKNEVGRIAYLEKTTNIGNLPVKVIGGAEFNLNQVIPKGKDYHNKLMKLKWKPIGLHTWFVNVENTTLNQLYCLFEIAAMNLDNFTTFAHIERELQDIDNKRHGSILDDEIKEFLEKVVLIAKKYDIILEVNEASLIRNEGGGKERVRYWLNFAKENKCKISLGTDAHFCMAVGDFTNTIELLNELDYPKELILNCNRDWLETMFN